MLMVSAGLGGTSRQRRTYGMISTPLLLLLFLSVCTAQLIQEDEGNRFQRRRRRDVNNGNIVDAALGVVNQVNGGAQALNIGQAQQQNFGQNVGQQQLNVGQQQRIVGQQPQNVGQQQQNVVQQQQNFGQQQQNFGQQQQNLAQQVPAQQQLAQNIAVQEQQVGINKRSHYKGDSIVPAAQDQPLLAQEPAPQKVQFQQPAQQPVQFHQPAQQPEQHLQFKFQQDAQQPAQDFQPPAQDPLKEARQKHAKLFEELQVAAGQPKVNAKDSDANDHVLRYYHKKNVDLPANDNNDLGGGEVWKKRQAIPVNDVFDAEKVRQVQQPGAGAGVQVQVERGSYDTGRGKLQSSIDGHPYIPPNDKSVSRVNVSQLLQQIDPHKKPAWDESTKIPVAIENPVFNAEDDKFRNDFNKPFAPINQDSENDPESEWAKKKHKAIEDEMIKFNANKPLADGLRRERFEDGGINGGVDSNANNNQWNKNNEQWNNDRNNAQFNDNGGNNNNDDPYRRKKPKKFKIPTAAPRPDPESRNEVVWFEENRQYALKASVDARIRIRHAPIVEDGSPWPMPQKYHTTDTQLLIRPSRFSFNDRSSHSSCDILRYGIERVRRNMFGDAVEDYGEDDGSYSRNFFARGGKDEQVEMKELTQLNITVNMPCNDASLPHLNMNESYALKISRLGATLTAPEVWGALRGLETFSQLVYQDTTGKFVVNRTSIIDYPRFPHRGILLDTARHYLDKDTIIANLEAMAQNKLNVFHWHIVDEQSFPFQSKMLPNLTKHGAYDANHVYTQEDIGQIIEEARLRGIRVIPEFDTPGHTFAWGLGQDNLLTPCYDYDKMPNGFYGPINPILKSTYRFLQTLFTEVFSVFKDKYMHLGGDEVPFDCWELNPFIQNFIRRNNLTDYRDVLSLYERKLLNIVDDIGEKREQGAGYIVWQEVFDNGVRLKPDAIVQIWMGDVWDIERVTRQGYRAIFSTCWYLDYINYGQDWDKYYKCEQMGRGMDDYAVKNKHLLIGGEACLWTEYADDDIVMPRLWPRASAAAERLWSDESVNDHLAAAPRIEEQRCRMKRRGLKVGVLGGPGICRKYKKQRKSSSSSFIWSAKTRSSEERDEDIHLGFNGPAKQVYMVDMNSLYVVPLLCVLVVGVAAILATLRGGDHHRHKFITILTFPVKSRKGMRSLLYGFMVFVLVWCIWSSPMWLNTWESGNQGVHKIPTERSHHQQARAHHHHNKH